jgi:MGT family glycosyltransferase
MSQIVFLLPPAQGHVNPALPVVQALARRGEQVTVYNTEEFRAKTESSGAVFRAYPPSDLSAAEISRRLEQGNLSNVTGLILRATEQMLPGLLEMLARDAPDLIVFDSIALWGKMAATRLGVRAAASISHFVMDEKHMTPRDLLRMLRQVLPNVPGLLRARGRLIRQYGRAYPTAQPLFPMRAGLNLVFTARDLQPATPIIDETFRFVGPSIDPQMRPQLRGEDFPFEALGAGPVVYISMGTVHTAPVEFLRACFQAFGEVRGQFILAAGQQADLSALGPVPANFIVRPSVPQLAILERADVFITHGGINSVHEGLYHGVPLVLIPHQFEQLLNARCVAARGAGLILEERLLGKPLGAARLRQALEAVRAEPRYREAARALQQAVRATGGYRLAADEIQAYLIRS